MEDFDLSPVSQKEKGRLLMEFTEQQKYTTSSQRWGTTEERAFVAGLGAGEYGDLPALTGEAKRLLLGRYIQAARRRTNWGTIDQTAVIRYAQSLLAQGGGRRPGW